MNAPVARQLCDDVAREILGHLLRAPEGDELMVPRATIADWFIRLATTAMLLESGAGETHAS